MCKHQKYIFHLKNCTIYNSASKIGSFLSKLIQKRICYSYFALKEQYKSCCNSSYYMVKILKLCNFLQIYQCKWGLLLGLHNDFFLYLSRACLQQLHNYVDSFWTFSNRWHFHNKYSLSFTTPLSTAFFFLNQQISLFYQTVNHDCRSEC